LKYNGVKIAKTQNLYLEIVAINCKFWVKLVKSRQIKSNGKQQLDPPPSALFVSKGQTDITHNFILSFYAHLIFDKHSI